MDDNATLKFTGDEAAGLWHAVEWMKLCLSQDVGTDEKHMEFDKRQLANAKKALRKVQALRREAKAKRTRAASEIGRTGESNG